MHLQSIFICFLNFQRDDQYILTACQDRNIRVYNVDTGKHSKTFKGSQSEDGTLIKVNFQDLGPINVVTEGTCPRKIYCHLGNTQFYK